MINLNKTQEELIRDATDKLASVVGTQFYITINLAIRDIVKAAQTYNVYGVEADRTNTGDNE